MNAEHKIVADSTSAVPSQFPVLSRSLHGFHCERGQLWLSDAEAEMIWKHIRPYGFSFELVPSNQEPKARSKRKAAASPAPPLDPDVLRPRRKSCLLQQTEFHTSGINHSRQNSSSVTSGGKSLKRQKIEYEGGMQTLVVNSAGSFMPAGCSSSISVSKSNTANNTLRSPKTTTTVPTRSSRRRREVLTGRWEDACASITSKLEAEPSARWFLSPVDPEANKVPDYLEKIKCPMDFTTIKQKLNHGMYSHPFRWQEDVRTIFYNAFTYHEAGNLIWSDARYLADLFEKLCKETEGVNPYAVYGQPSARKRVTDMTSSHEPVPRTNTRLLSPRGSFEGSKTKSFKGIEDHLLSADTITLEAAKLRELLEKAASVAAAQQHAAVVAAVAATEGGKGKSEFLGTGIGKGAAFWGMGKLARQNSGMEGIVSPSGSSSAAVVQHHLPQQLVHQSQIQFSPSQPTVRPSLPPATLPEAPPPPVAAAIKPGEKPPNVVHKRLAAAQFRDLDVHYRKAVCGCGESSCGSPY